MSNSYYSDSSWPNLHNVGAVEIVDAVGTENALLAALKHFLFNDEIASE